MHTMSTSPARATRLLASLAGAMLTLGSVTLAPSASADPVRPRSTVPEGTITVGDSVMLGARTQLRGRDFRVDAAVSRQAYKGPALLRERGARLPRNVVVHLGTNGTFDIDTCRRIVKTAGPQRIVYFVTIHADRRWVAGNNRVIRDCDRAFAEHRVRVIDWNRAANDHEGWTYADGIHLRPDGAKAYARLIAQAVARNAAASAVPSPR